jgi:hypothetical protein
MMKVNAITQVGAREFRALSPTISRINPELQPNASCCELEVSVHLQSADRCAPDGREPDYRGIALVNLEMLRPPLRARMKQGNFRAGFRINCRDVIGFQAIACVAGEGQILLGGRTAKRFWHDVLKLKLEVEHGRRRPAIITAVLRPQRHRRIVRVHRVSAST